MNKSPPLVSPCNAEVVGSQRSLDPLLILGAGVGVGLHRLAEHCLQTAANCCARCVSSGLYVNESHLHLSSIGDSLPAPWEAPGQLLLKITP